MERWWDAAARSLELGGVLFETVAHIGRVVRDIAQDPEAGLIVVAHTFPFSNRDAAVAAMAEHRVLAIDGIAEWWGRGLISCGQDLGDHWRLGASYVDRILRGASLSKLPAQYSTN